ncbi:hypothetical protein [Haloflavibacter putidus]|uniref:Uncharacterized protein n=1 Tax=Haloflavibacter putidus TaxID=2576776 RepID=A0A507ZWF3_9FLAO|nr:hypothetical protein [Haloflavibacter putidus]TQD40594.1 hypothetical protein FKR84_01050 [Haloflavibacter putidus]
MKKTFLGLSFLMLFFSYSLQAQIYTNYSIEKSKTFKDKKKHSELVFTANDDNGGTVIVRMYYAGLITKSPKGYLIEYYDSDLNLVNDAEYEIDDSSIKNIFIKDQKLHLISYERDRKSNTNVYSVLSAPLSTMKFTEKELFSLSRKEVKKPFYFAIGAIPITNQGKIDHDPTGEVWLSDNKKFFVFNFDLKDDDNQTNRVLVYNDNLEKVFEHEFKSDLRDRLFSYNDIVVNDKDGTVYFLGKAYENDSKRKKKDGEANYHFKLYKLNKDGMQEANFDTAENFVVSMKLVHKKDQLVCVGFYSDKHDNRAKVGTVYYRLNPENLAVEKQKFNRFTEQFLIDKYGEKRGKRKKRKGKEKAEFTYRGIYINDVGDVIFSAEEYYVITSTVYGGMGASTTQTTYHFDDIFSCRMNPSGEMIWARNINKKQEAGTKSPYLSFTAMPFNNKTLIFLNAADKVKKMRDDRIRFKDKRAKKMNMYLVEIDMDGNFDYKKIIDNSESKVTYKVMHGISNKTGDKLIFEGSKGRKKKMVEISLN